MSRELKDAYFKMDVREGETPRMRFTRAAVKLFQLGIASQAASAAIRDNKYKQDMAMKDLKAELAKKKVEYDAVTQASPKDHVIILKVLQDPDAKKLFESYLGEMETPNDFTELLKVVKHPTEK